MSTLSYGELMNKMRARFPRITNDNLNAALDRLRDEHAIEKVSHGNFRFVPPPQNSKRAKETIEALSPAAGIAPQDPKPTKTAEMTAVRVVDMKSGSAQSAAIGYIQDHPGCTYDDIERYLKANNLLGTSKVATIVGNANQFYRDIIERVTVDGRTMLGITKGVKIHFTEKFPRQLRAAVPTATVAPTPQPLASRQPAAAAAQAALTKEWKVALRSGGVLICATDTNLWMVSDEDRQWLLNLEAFLKSYDK